MTKGQLFWLLMIIWFIFGIWSFWPISNYVPVAGNVLLFIVIGLLGWATFQAPIKG